MKIWTLTINDNDGSSTKVFTDRALLDAEAEAWVKEAWHRKGFGPTPTHWPSAVEWLIENAPDFYDWIGAAEHEIAVPPKREWFAGQALAGLMANTNLVGVEPDSLSHPRYTPKDAATDAVASADALIDALK